MMLATNNGPTRVSKRIRNARVPASTKPQVVTEVHDIRNLRQHANIVSCDGHESSSSLLPPFSSPLSVSSNSLSSKRNVIETPRRAPSKVRNVCVTTTAAAAATCTSNETTTIVWDDSQWHLRRSRKRRKFCALTNNESFGPYNIPQQDDEEHQTNYFPTVGIVLVPIEPYRRVIFPRKDGGSLPYTASPYVLYRSLRVRMGAGFLWSSFDTLGRLLEQYYANVILLLSRTEDGTMWKKDHDALLGLRDKIAGIWCIYAHVLVDAGCFMGKTTTPFDNLANHSIRILLTAMDCPLVGNHTAVGLSLGRLIVARVAVKHTNAGVHTVEVSKDLILGKLRSAMDVCWDCLNRCRNKASRRFRFEGLDEKIMGGFYRSLEEKQGSKLHSRPDALCERMEHTLELPKELRAKLRSFALPDDRMIIQDKNVVRSLCKELNRWSRLEEDLNDSSLRSVRLSPSTESVLSYEAEELPLFAPVEILSDPLKHYEGGESMGSRIAWQW